MESHYYTVNFYSTENKTACKEKESVQAEWGYVEYVF